MMYTSTGLGNGLSNYWQAQQSLNQQDLSQQLTGQLLQNPQSPQSSSLGRDEFIRFVAAQVGAEPSEDAIRERLLWLKREFQQTMERVRNVK